MDVYKPSIQALGTGDLTLGDGTFEMLYLKSGYAVDVDLHDFEDDLGANISHRETLVNPTWVDRVFDADDMTVTDPDNGETVTQKAVVKSANGAGGAGGGGTAATNRVLCHQALAANVTWDGTNDEQTFDAQGLFRIGAA